MSDNCPETCSKHVLLGYLRDESSVATVIQEVTGYELSSSVGVSFNPEEPAKAADFMLTSANVYERPNRGLNREELDRVNNLRVERGQRVIDLTNALDECPGPAGVELEDGSRAKICGAEVVRVVVSSEPTLEA
jgi:hypothetical protein